MLQKKEWGGRKHPSKKKTKSSVSKKHDLTGGGEEVLKKGGKGDKHLYLISLLSDREGEAKGGDSGSTVGDAYGEYHAEAKEMRWLFD